MSNTMPFRTISTRDLETLPQIQGLPPEHRHAMKVIAQVLPFRVNNYVIDELIDWDQIPHDPIFQLTFPQPGMLEPDHFARMERAMLKGNPQEMRSVADAIRRELEPHPAGQRSLNVPMLDDEPVPGVQHKYLETCLVFPSSGQTCHAYCTFCFRWPQFVGMPDLKFATDEAMRFVDYVSRQDEITDVLFTGGDPMIMRTDLLAKYVDPILSSKCSHVETVRIGTKSLSYWPYRFTTDRDADDLLRLFERIVDSGKHLAIMAHINHWKELETPVVAEAIRRVRSTGAIIRAQAPLIRHINDNADTWARMWQKQVRLGCIPYYLFVERQTGAKSYFSLPLARALEIYQSAIQQVSGLARTARGPVMSALPGKVMVEGTAEIRGEKVFVLSLLQARDPSWCRRPFFARFDPKATWEDQLSPAFGEQEFFYQPEMRRRLRPSLALVSQ